MKVKELREELSKYPDELEVEFLYGPSSNEYGYRIDYCAGMHHIDEYGTISWEHEEKLIDENFDVVILGN